MDKKDFFYENSSYEHIDIPESILNNRTILTFIDNFPNEKIFKIKQKDTLPYIRVRISGVGDIDLSGCKVYFKMMNGFMEKVIDRQVDVDSHASDLIVVKWLEGDTDSIGTYLAEFKIVFPNLKIMTVPTDGYLTIKIIREIR